MVHAVGQPGLRSGRLADWLAEGWGSGLAGLRMGLCARLRASVQARMRPRHRGADSAAGQHIACRKARLQRCKAFALKRQQRAHQGRRHPGQGCGRCDAGVQIVQAGIAPAQGGCRRRGVRWRVARHRQDVQAHAHHRHALRTHLHRLDQDAAQLVPGQGGRGCPGRRGLQQQQVIGPFQADRGALQPRCRRLRAMARPGVRVGRIQRIGQRQPHCQRQARPVGQIQRQRQ